MLLQPTYTSAFIEITLRKMGEVSSGDDKRKQNVSSKALRKNTTRKT